MKKRTITKSMAIAVAIGSLAIPFTVAKAATDTQYDANDLLLFFQNPAGSVGTDQVVSFSLGSTWDVFRRAATPGDPTYGTVISLGNINTILTNTYGTDWTSLESTLFGGAAGQNGSTAQAAATTSNQDYARTAYLTKFRTGEGTLGQSNSASLALPAGAAGQSTLAANISGSNTSPTQPAARAIGDTLIDNNNPFSSGNPSTAYGQVSGGVMGAISDTTYSLGSISNIVLGLDLYRATPVLNASGWQDINGISGVTARNGYYLGTVTVSSGGDVNFVAIPEPTTTLLAVGSFAFMAVARRGRNGRNFRD